MKEDVYEVLSHFQRTTTSHFCFCCLFSGQHRGRVRAYGGGRSHVQGVPHPPQKPEDPGGGRGDHPPEPRHQARDLVGSDHQLLDRGSTLARRRRGSSSVSVLCFFFKGGCDVLVRGQSLTLEVEKGTA